MWLCSCVVSELRQPKDEAIVLSSTWGSCSGCCVGRSAVVTLPLPAPLRVVHNPPPRPSPLRHLPTHTQTHTAHMHLQEAATGAIQHVITAMHAQHHLWPLRLLLACCCPCCHCCCCCCCPGGAALLHQRQQAAREGILLRCACQRGREIGLI
jgi:hypothetical protein